MRNPHRRTPAQSGKKAGRWSGRGDSNPRLQLGKLPYYPYTTAALTFVFIAQPLRGNKRRASRSRARDRGGASHFSVPPRGHLENTASQLIFTTRVAFTTGDFFCLSAKLAAFSRSV
jgi:hypothetical protein